jgi:phosphatidylserine/phosphatidylglycerophosphate/cardiolipin synthase-like enzyme
MKMKFLFSALLILAGFAAQAQVITCQAARAAGPGSTVTVRGIVTNGDELGSIRYLQDSTGGIAAYSSTLANVNRGDSIEISGTLKDYNQLLEIDPVTSFTVLSTGNALPAPEVIVPDSMNEAREGMLVQINNATFTTNPGGTFSSNTSYNFTANGQSSSIYVRSNHPLIGEIVPSGAVTLVGIESQFSYSSPTSGYQLLLRDTNDIINTMAISITSAVTLDSLSTAGFTLDWTTNNPGSTEIYYGTTEALGNHMSTADTNTSHHIKITGGNPSQLYYVKAFSVVGMDTAYAPINVFVTQSVSSGDMKVYFNTPTDHSVSTGTNAVTLPNAIDDTLVAYINRATESIDFTMYNFTTANLADVATALNNADGRGVTVRVIFDNSAGNTGIQQLNSTIGKISNPSGSQYGIMHNKFIVFDAHSTDPNVPIVWTGGTNLTDGQINTDPNNVIIIQDKSLALAYTLEFDEMFGSTTGTPSLTESRFGPDKLDNTPHDFIIGGSDVKCYFSPSDGTNDEIINEIGRASTSIDIATMLITRSDIAYALQDAVNNNSVDMHVLVNHENDCSATVWGILSSLLDTALQDDQSQSGIMHHKFMVVDNGLSSASVLNGSHNWSNAANNKNDENTLVIYNEEVANQYYQAFYYRFKQNQTNGIATGSFSREVKLYPNPAQDNLTLELSAGKAAQASVSIFGMDGKVVMQEQHQLFSGSTQLRLDISSLTAGVYMLQINTAEGSYVNRIVVE